MRYFDPHPGLMGCPEPIPEAVRLVANELVTAEGVSLPEAIAKIQAACPEGRVRAVDEGHGIRGGMIVLEVGEAFRMGDHIFAKYNWRVISYHWIDEYGT